jgi:hypothetical protein
VATGHINSKRIRCYETPHEVVGALLSGSNVYFARTQTSIYIPQTQTGAEPIVVDLQREVCKLPKFIQIKMRWQAGEQEAVDAASPPLRRSLPAFKERDDEEQERLMRQAIAAAVEGRPILQETASQPGSSEPAEVSYRRVEFNALRQPYDDPKDADLRIRDAGVPASLKDYIGRVRLVEKLRASRVFLGFDRVKPGNKHGRAAAEDALQQIFRQPPAGEDRWLPGIETRGEGIYLELQEEAIHRWLEEDGSRSFLQDRLKPDYRKRLNSERFLAPSTGTTGEAGLQWVARYLLCIVSPTR